jgi:hypothetical protein
MTGGLTRPFLLSAAVATIAAAALTGCASSAGGGTAGRPAADLQPAEHLVITGGWVFTATGDDVARNRGILIRDSVIVAMQLGGGQADIPGARIIELDDDDFIVPGFFDLHAHYAVDLLGNGRVDETSA